MLYCKFYIFIIIYHDFFIKFWTLPRILKYFNICREDKIIFWKPLIRPVNKQRFCCLFVVVFNFWIKKFFKKKIFFFFWFLFFVKQFQIFNFNSIFNWRFLFNCSKSNSRLFCVLLKFIIYRFHQKRYQQYQ